MQDACRIPVHLYTRNVVFSTQEITLQLSLNFNNYLYTNYQTVYIFKHVWNLTFVLLINYQGILKPLLHVYAQKKDGEYDFPCKNLIKKDYHTFYLNESQAFCF